MTAGLLALAVFGCAVPRDRDGTAVGNPGNMDVALVDQPEHITLTRADLAVDGIDLFGCDGRPTYLDVDVVLDALGPSDPLEIPAGTWCSAVLLLDPRADEGQFVLEGETDSGTSFIAPLFPEEVVITNRFVVDGNSLLIGIALGDLLDAEFIDTLPEMEGPVELEGDPLDTGVDDFLAAGEVWEDVDLNGIITTGDLLLGSIEDGIADTGDGPKSDKGRESSCGCQTSPPTTWLGLLGLIALFRRRPD